MSDSVTIDGTPPPLARSGEEPRRPAEPAIAIEDVPSGPTDADVIREARAALEQTAAQRDEARRRATEAERVAAGARSEASQARDAAARAAQGRTADQRMVLAQTVEAADGEIARAKAALRAAGEAGDYDALGEAQVALSSATYRKNNAAGQLAALGEAPAAGDQGGGANGQQPGRQQPPPQQGNWTPGARARQWLSEHPRMDSDPEYQATAVMAHNQALRRGIQAESDAYFEHVNRVINAAYPDDAARGEPNGGQPMPGNRDQGNGGDRANGGGNGGGHASSAGPSNRGGSQQQGGWKPIKTGLGTVNVSEAGGRTRISFPDASVRDNMEEGAQVCDPVGWNKDPAKALAEYTFEQIRIAREIESGASANLIIGEGRHYS